MDDDHKSIKSSKIARLMEEPDMQCKHVNTSRHSNDCEPQGTDEVSFVMDDTKHENTDSWNHHVCGHEVNGKELTDPSDKECLVKETKCQQASSSVEISESKTVKENAVKVKEVPSSGLQEKGTSPNNPYNAEQNSENVANVSELSSIEGMTDAGELSEPEGGVPVSRGKIKRKKRKKPKNNKNIHKPVLNNPRRKSKTKKARSAVEDAGIPHPCSVCKRDCWFLCYGCEAAWYCSSECQLSAWGTHIKECTGKACEWIDRRWCGRVSLGKLAERSTPS